MSKIVKELMKRDLKSRYTGLSSVCVVDLTGMDVQSQEKLRRTLRAKSARLEVVKNSVARQAFLGSPLEPLGSALVGPCALVTSPSPVETAKLLIAAAKEFTTLKLKQAIYEGDSALLSVESLSKMRSRADLLGEVAMLLISPARALAGCLRAPQAKIAGCLKARIDNGDASE
jgi:large subunit ribosomal protein L10